MRRNIVLIAAGVALGVLVGPGAALAAWKRQNASTCRPASTGDYGTYFDSEGLRNPFPSGGNRLFICPFSEASNLRRISVTTLNVHGTNTSAGTTSVSACRKVWNASGASGTGFSCGLASSTSSVGVYGLGIGDLSSFNGSENDFGYVQVSLPYLATVYGIYAAY